MFNPNIPCRIQVSSGKNDVWGQPIPGEFVNERCGVVKLLVRSEKSAVRADSSASRGAAREFQSDAVVLLGRNTRANIDDLLVVMGVHLRITGIHQRFGVSGALDHHQVEAKFWSIE